MSKRQTFYTRADLFEADLSTRAKLVLTYLSRISDRQGVRFPSIPTIAEIREKTPEEVAALTMANGLQLFGISRKPEAGQEEFTEFS